MRDEDFDGTLVLEKLAETGLVDAFYEAIDADDFESASMLMKKAQVPIDTIKTVLKMMRDAGGSH